VVTLTGLKGACGGWRSAPPVAVSFSVVIVTGPVEADGATGAPPVTASFSVVTVTGENVLSSAETQADDVIRKRTGRTSIIPILFFLK